MPKLQQNDPDLKLLYNAKKEGHQPDEVLLKDTSPACRYYFNVWSSIVLKDDTLYKEYISKDGNYTYLQLLLPHSLREEVLQQMHNSIVSGHLGIKKTTEKIKKLFYWYEMRTDIQVWIEKCHTCQMNKISNKPAKAPMGNMSTGAPMDRLSIDILGPLPRTPRGNKYILVAMDYFSKWVEILPVPDQTSETCADKILNEVIARYGCPQSIHSDQGRNFESSLFQEFCKILEIKKTRTTPRNPRANGLVERFNRTLISMIKSYIKGKQTDWDKNLGCLALAYRSTPQESTKFTPNMIMLGKEVKLPLHVIYSDPEKSEECSSYGDYLYKLRENLYHSHQIVRKNLKCATNIQKNKYDKKSNLNQYQTGDLVSVLMESPDTDLESHKLQPKYIGPCLILQKINNLLYKVKTSEQANVKMIHHNKMKPYVGEMLPWMRKFIKKN